MLKKTFVCPYCFDIRRISHVQFRCTNKRCPDVDDVEMTKYENGDLKTPKQGKRTFNVKNKKGLGIPKSAECPEPSCRQKTFKIVCPSCHNTLPESTLTGKDMIISVVGSRNTGKTNFVGVLINELIERISVRFGGAMVGFDDSMTRYREGIYNDMYVNGKTPDLTQSSIQNINNGAYRPLIFTLNIKKKAFLGQKIESFTFVFFDTAGEDLNDEDTMSTVNKYICKSAGIIFLLDPMQIPAVSTQLDEDVVSRASSVDWRKATRADDIMTRVSNLIRKDRNMSKTKQIDIPVAAVFSKFDAITGIVPEGCTILEPSPHCASKAFVLSDWHNVNSEIHGLLTTWGGDAFVAQLDVNYTKYSYFTVSALGLNNNPRADKGIERPRPHRIEDPLLWLMKENDVIKVKKQR